VDLALFWLVFYFCVGYGGFASGAPVYGEGALVDVVLFVEFDERELGFAPVVGVAGLVFCCPVYAAAEAFYGCAHYVDVFVYELVAEFYEFVGWHVGFFDVVVFFGFDFCWESVAVEALGEEDVVASHAFEAGYYVEVGVVEGVPHVEIATRIGRGSVDGEDWT